MTTPLQGAQEAILKAREALRNGDRRLARQWAERASKLAPQLEDPWLILAAVAEPQLGLEYLKRALRINPDSPRARKGMEWALQRLREIPPEPAEARGAPTTRRGRRGPRPPAAAAVPGKQAAPQRRSPVLGIFLVTLGSAILGLAGWTAATSPVVASIIRRPALAAQAPQAPQWARVSIPKPTYTPAAAMALALPTATPTVMATATVSAELPTATSDLSGAGLADFPTTIPGDAAAGPEIPAAEPMWSGTLTMEYVPDALGGEAPVDVPPDLEPSAPMPPNPELAASGENWIDVDLTRQMLYAYAGDTVVNSFLVSTGTWQTPTVTGKYNIWVKFPLTDMSGPDYYLPDVPNVMYFFQDYGIHGTYWHHNFGTPMSHGCVNMSLSDAEWLYDFASIGTVVNVHY